MSTPNDAKYTDHATYKKWSRRIVFGAILVFLPVFGIAVWSLWNGLQLLANGGGTTEEVGESLAGGIVGIILAIGIPCGLHVAAAKTWPYVQGRQRYPDQPWMWRTDWAEGRIPYSRVWHMAGFWIGWCAFSVVVFVVAWQFTDAISDTGFSPEWAYGVVALASIATFALAVVETQRWRKFGTSYCHLVQNPGVLGGWLRTRIEIPVAMKPGDAVRVILKLVFRSSRDSSSNRREIVVWQLDRTVPFDSVDVQDNQRTFVPAEFFIPKQIGVETSPGAWGSHRWRLEANAQLMGLDYAAEFVVPVFETKNSRDEVPPEAVETFGEAVDMAKKFRAPDHIRVTPVESGIEIRTVPMQTSKYLLLTFILAAAGTGAVVLLGWPDLGAPFKVVGLLLIAPIFVILAVMLFCRRVLTLTPNAVVRDTNFLGIRRKKAVPIQDVREIWVEATQGSKGGETYRVDIKTKDSPPTPGSSPPDKVRVHWKINISGITVADSISDKNQALWLKQLVESYLFPEPRRTPAAPRA